MIEYNILMTEEFEKDYLSLDNSLKLRIKNAVDQLKTNPYSGKPLGYEFFREKKVGGLRVYYLIYEEKVIVFVIALSDKKAQVKTIDAIKELMPLYMDELKKSTNSTF